MPQAVASGSSWSTPQRSQRTGFSHWDALCDLVAHIVVLPVVCMSVCSAMGLLLGLECIEKLPPALNTAMECVLGPHTTVYDDDSGREKTAQDDDGDAAARRPLKKQRADADTHTPTTSTNTRVFAATTSANTATASGLDASPLVRTLHPASTLASHAALKRRVVIWDLDETLVLFASLYTGAFAQTHGKDVATGVQLGEQMMTFLLVMLDRHFFFDELHDADVAHIHALSTDAALADSAHRVRYERIRAIYERKRAVDFLTDAHSEWFAIRETLVAAIDAFSTGWLHEARQVLTLLSAPSGSSKRMKNGSGTPVTTPLYENINVLVTNSQLAPALCKCLVYGLDAFFPIESVYSSATVRKQTCFEQILHAYASGASGVESSADVEFIAIGDGAEEEHVSHALGIEFHKICSLTDLQRLRVDLELDAQSFM